LLGSMIHFGEPDCWEN